MNTTIGVDRRDGEDAVTLDQLGRFVQHAMRAGAPGDTPIKAVVTWRGGLRRVTLTVDVDPETARTLMDSA